MLTCYSHRVRLPQSNLVYLGFRIAVQETLSDIELSLELEEEPDPPVGYLTEVPFLEQVPLPVQVDLLGNVWARQRRAEWIEASLLDAAIIYAAFKTARRVINDEPEVASAMLRSGPRRVNPRILSRAPCRLYNAFEQFWDDRDFLLIEEFQDLPPDHAQRLKRLLRLPEEVLKPMYEALERWRVSAELGANLEGLLSKEEIQETLPLLEGNRWPPRPTLVDDADDDVNWVTGIEDRFHDLLVGPCDPAAAEVEGECLSVWEISISSPEDFDCTYEEWVQHLRGDVLQAAEERPDTSPFSLGDTDLAERVQQAMNSGLEDGARIERRDNGWVVVDNFQSFLADPDDASWVVDPVSFGTCGFNSHLRYLLTLKGLGL